MFKKLHKDYGFSADLRINISLSLQQEHVSGHTGYALLWAADDGWSRQPLSLTGSLSLWLTASLGFQTTTVCPGTQTGLGPPAWLFFQTSVPSFTHPLSPLSLSINLYISPSRPSIHHRDAQKLSILPASFRPIICMQPRRSARPSQTITVAGKTGAEREQMLGI